MTERTPHVNNYGIFHSLLHLLIPVLLLLKLVDSTSPSTMGGMLIFRAAIGVFLVDHVKRRHHLTNVFGPNYSLDTSFSELLLLGLTAHGSKIIAVELKATHSLS